MDEVKLDLQDKSAHISSLNKTPVTIVQEYASKRHLCPRYDLVHNGTKQNTVTFFYRVELQGIETIGEGSSKKEAKHVAASKLLQKLLEVTPESFKNEFKQFDLGTRVVSPYDKNIKENAVGQLNDICCNLKLKLPEFKEVREEGQAHAKLFTVSCQVAKLIEEATHKTKQQAKQLAAQQMVKRLTSMDKTLITPIDQSVSDSMRVIEIVEPIMSHKLKKNAPMDEDISNYHLFFKNNEWPNTETLVELVQQMDSDSKLMLTDPISVLNKVVEECEMLLQKNYIDENCILGPSKKHCCLMSVNNVYPPVFGMGIELSPILAETTAATELLTNMCILFI
ncbi:RISC-loading complex subunit tarbp2-like [Adelges cooleyi]|uniref:RISC-loading complex subunit tarbp2-like n=1 Tax=Adelges cooleyi TaxID=133065 RepID=UPI0021803E61|nr:RISC-loading complex subunit tarbp2-like [Adelges cooleyi]